MSMYKKGDLVLVKSKYDKGCGCNNYRCGFLEDMLQTFGGCICTISYAKPVLNTKVDDRLLPDDSTVYCLEEDGNDYSWSSSMFEPEF